MANASSTGFNDYVLLGHSGLRVSPLCLGTMTFGTEWGWGSPEETAESIFNHYLEAGGNFIDTADMYTNGKSEELLGKFLANSGKRERVVLASKYTFNGAAGDPNAGGNHRKNLLRAIDGSLKRLRTDYIDLYWMHCWDGLTPVEEVMSTMDALVRAGKIRYIGLSDTPAWYLTRAQTTAEFRGWEKVCALQLEYSLIERNIEREHVPAALHMGMGICPWSPLGGGFLSGKYQRTTGTVKGEGRLIATQNDPIFNRFSDRNWSVLGALTEVAKELGKSPAQIALNWATKRPGVASTIIGATKIPQLEDNLKALTFDLPPSLANKLELASAPAPQFPYTFFQPANRDRISGGMRVHAEPTWFRQ